MAVCGKCIHKNVCEFCKEMGFQNVVRANDFNCKDYLPEDNVVEVKWISVKDRLPEHTEDVLCWYEYYRYGSYNRMFQTYGIGYWINGHWGGEVSNGTKCRVIAWQPLPQPPKGADI